MNPITVEEFVRRLVLSPAEGTVALNPDMDPANLRSRVEEAVRHKKAGARCMICYDRKEPDDGTRILVMRRWPRGISRDQIDEWRKDLGPSVELLQQWNDGEIGFAEFRARYLAEMQSKTEEVHDLARRARTETITLLCHEKSEDHCHRKMLKDLIEQQMNRLS